MKQLEQLTKAEKREIMRISHVCEIHNHLGDSLGRDPVIVDSTDGEPLEIFVCDECKKIVTQIIA